MEYGRYYKIELDVSDVVYKSSGMSEFRIGFRTEQDDAAASAFVVDGVALEICESSSAAPSPTPRAHPTATPAVPPSNSVRVYLPITYRFWPPVPDRPTLLAIDNVDGDGTYLVSWTSASRASQYILQESSGPTFSDAHEAYRGSSRSWTASSKSLGTHYYRVRASNSYGASAWSAWHSASVNRARIFASADAAVIEHAVRNVGDLGSLWMGYHKAPCLDYRGDLGQARSMVKFDLAGIPWSATIRRATLTVDPVAACWSKDGPRTYSVHRARSPWSEMSARWGNRPDHAESYGSVTRNMSLSDRSIMNPHQFDVTNLVRKWFRGDEPNNGLVLVGPETSGGGFSILLVASREYGASSSRPQLEVVLGGMGAAATQPDPLSLKPSDPSGDEPAPVCESRGSSTCCIEASLAATADGRALLEQLLVESPGSSQ
jgi:hypothetical protein